MNNDKTLYLARDLGVIASGERLQQRRLAAPDEDTMTDSKAFAADLLRLIDERIAAARGGPSVIVRENKPSEVRVGDTFRRSSDHGEPVLYEVVELDQAAEIARLSGAGTWNDVWWFVSDLVGVRRSSLPSQWERVRAVDAPKTTPRKTFWICAGLDGCPGSGAIGGPRSCPNCHMPCVEVHTGGEPMEPLSATVAEGDTFMRLTSCATRSAGSVVTAVEVDEPGSEWAAVLLRGSGCRSTAPARELLHSGDWQRVPAGYVLPTAIEWHAATVRLIKAYRASLADPETGQRGAHECMQQMARMAGLEVPT